MDRKAGDVILLIKVKPHDKFTRKGADLFIEQEITLVEALTGVDFTLKGLDGSTIRV